MVDRASPSGPISSIKGTIAIGETAVAATAGATATGSFLPSRGPHVPANAIISLSPQANLTDNDLAVAWARVAVAGDTEDDEAAIIAICFTNVGAATTQAAVTFDATAQIR